MSAPTPFIHRGDAGEAVQLGIVNGLLNLATLFIWRFWAKTRVRRWLWSHTTVWGEPLEYTGLGGELFVGFLIIMVAVFLPIMVGFGFAQTLTTQGNPLGAVLAGILQLLTFVLIGAGLWRARRYLLSRTRWRGIRASQDGSAWKYGLVFLGVTLLAGLTIGWSWPWSDMMLARTRMAHTRFGDQPFACNATAGPLYKRYALVWACGIAYLTVAGLVFAGMAAMAGSNDMGWVPPSPEAIAGLYIGFLGLAVVLLALPYAWYKAGFYERLAEGTSFGEVRFAFRPTAWGLAGLHLSNLLIVMFTMGFGRPWASSRLFAFVCQRLEVFGEPDFAAIHQSNEELLKRGEGLAAVFDGAGEF